jgi:glycosyltransferase involved in cell wall biosynthesis
MRDELGKHKASYILNRVPGEFNKKYNIKTKTNKFKVLYFGNLWDYGPMLEELIVAARNNKTIQFEVRGNNPNWNKEFKETMEKTNQWLPFAPREEYEKWMFTAEAFLIPMLFEEKYKRRMVTSFPSKIAECVQVEKPIIIWGPEYCSAIQWARQGSKALCVTSSDPKELIKEIERLINDKEEIERLTEKSRYAALNEFNRNKILCQFNNTLKELLERYESNEKSQQMLSISEKP